MLCVLPEFSGKEPSAAQNGLVIQTCTQCGAVNSEHAQRCCFCDTRLARNEEVSADLDSSSPDDLSLTTPNDLGRTPSEPDWRREVAHRLKSYRARRRRQDPNDSQKTLPFNNGGDATDPETGDECASFLTPVRALELDRDNPRNVERVEIAVTKPDLDLAGPEYHPTGPRPRRAGAIEAPLLPVAALGERRRAGLLDAAFLLIAYAGFLALFGSLGGHFAFGKFDAAVCAATLVLFYAQYFALFTVFGGSTLGMLLCGLRVVSFDGSAPTSRQLLWRSFGYLVSGGTVLLGFLWALWDEDHLTWQDRISQTYLTPAARLSESESRGVARDT